MEQLVIHLVNLHFTIGLLWSGEISTFSSAKSFMAFTWTATVKPWALKTKKQNKKKGLKRLKCSIIWGKRRECYIFCRFSQSLIPLTHTLALLYTQQPQLEKPPPLSVCRSPSCYPNWSLWWWTDSQGCPVVSGYRILMLDPFSTLARVLRAGPAVQAHCVMLGLQQSLFH